MAIDLMWGYFIFKLSQGRFLRLIWCFWKQNKKSMTYSYLNVKTCDGLVHDLAEFSWCQLTSASLFTYLQIKELVPVYNMGRHINEKLQWVNWTPKKKTDLMTAPKIIYKYSIHSHLEVHYWINSVGFQVSREIIVTNTKQ